MKRILATVALVPSMLVGFAGAAAAAPPEAHSSGTSTVSLTYRSGTVVYSSTSSSHSTIQVKNRKFKQYKSTCTGTRVLHVVNGKVVQDKFKVTCV